MGERGSSRVLAKLEDSLAAGNYYEAHQMYRTLSYRYTIGRKWAALLDLLFHGAVKLLDLGQLGSGCDLAQLYAEKLEESLTPVSDSVLLRVEQLLSKVPYEGKLGGRTGASTSEGPMSETAGVVDKAKLIDTTIRWSKAVSSDALGRRKGHPDVHAKIAAVFWTDKLFPLARRHYMLSNDGEGCATFLMEYQMSYGYACEVDMFLAQAVLQFLANQKPPVAQCLFESYTLHHPSIPDGPPYQSPLLNFVWLLLLCVDMKRLQEFTVLLEQYKPSIDRDPAYIDYIHKIGEVYFGVPPPVRHPTGSNFFQNLFSSWNFWETYSSAKRVGCRFGMLKEDDESSDEETPMGGLNPNSSHVPPLQDTSELD